MSASFEAIVFYLLLIDSLCANFVFWFGPKWYVKNFRTFSRVFPPAKGWGELYFVLVVWIGFLLHRLDILF